MEIGKANKDSFVTGYRLTCLLFFMRNYVCVCVCASVNIHTYGFIFFLKMIQPAAHGEV